MIFALAGILFWGCSRSSSEDQARQIEVAISENLFAYDSLHISIWDENGRSQIFLVHSGPPLDSVIVVELNSAIPETYQLVVRGYAASGREDYFKSYLYNGKAFVDPQDIRVTPAAARAVISPRNVTIPAGASVTFTLSADPPEQRSFFWYAGSRFLGLTSDSSLMLDTVGRELNNSYIYALAGNENGYVYSDTALLIVEPAPAYDLSSPFPENGALHQPLFLTLSWAPLITAPSTPPVYRIRLGKDSIPLTNIAENLSASSFKVTGLEQNRTWFWQVAAMIGGTELEGPIWHFTTAVSPPGNGSPRPPVADAPMDTSVNQPVNGLVLRWTCSDPNPNDSLFYDVYLDVGNPPESSPASSKVASGIPGRQLTVNGLLPNRRYFWRIVVSDKMSVTESRIFSFVTMDAPVISVIQPAAGQQWEGGSVKYISWSSGGNISSVRLEYSLTSGASWIPILASCPADSAQYAWTVPETISNTARIRISDIASIAADTSGIFSIIDVPLAQGLYLVYPTGGETWQAGNAYPILWISQGNIVSVMLEYITGGSSFIITNNTPNNGQFDWTAPDFLADSLVRIRVSTLDRAVSDSSKGVILITAKKDTIMPGWNYSTDIYLNTSPSGAGVYEAVTGFPVLIRLNASNFNFSQASGGLDIRFTKADGITRLPHEIERWDDNKNLAEIWVRVDTVLGNSSTQHIVMFWGNLLASDASAPSEVFRTADGFAGAWHMVDTSDATANGNTARTVPSGAPARMDGHIGPAMDFNGATDYMIVDDSPTLDMNGEFTVSGWFRWDGGIQHNWNRLVSRKAFWSDAAGWELALIQGSDNGLQVNTGGVTQLMIYNTVDSWSSGAWEYLTVVFNRATSTAYRNGILAFTGTITPVQDNDLPLLFGDNAGLNEANWNGGMDEVRLVKGIRSPGWTKLCYENQKAIQTLVRLGL